MFTKGLLEFRVASKPEPGRFIEFILAIENLAFLETLRKAQRQTRRTRVGLKRKYLLLFLGVKTTHYVDFGTNH